MNFVIQTINGKITLDFAFQLERSLEFQVWRDQEDIQVRYCELDDIPKLAFIVDEIPVGTVDFVLTYIRTFVKKEIAYYPINVPPQLAIPKFRDNIVHSYVVDDENEPIDVKFDNFSAETSSYYVKSMDEVKSKINGVYHGMFKLPMGIYQISEMQKIVSEWRVFVNGSRMLDCRCYDGDFKVNPDYSLISEMIKQYDRHDPYTLDVFVNDAGKTQVLEVHDFWSCGLYGFNYNGLAYMIAQGYYALRRAIIGCY